MPDSLLAARQDFFHRVRAPAWIGRVAAGWPRAAVTALLAALAPVVLLLAALVGPAGFLRALTSPENVHATFARFLTAVATASSIAVSVALLTFRREMRGVERTEEREQANSEFRARVREAAGLREAPLLVGELVGEVLAAAAAKARDAREAAHGRALDTLAGGVSLRAYLDLVEARAERTAGRMPHAWGQPDRLHLAILDFDQQMTVALARRFSRDPHLPESARARMSELHGILTQYVVLARMVKTLDLEWGLSRMCQTILAATVPALGVAAAMTLTYGEGAVAAWGEAGAATLVCLALFLVLVPIAAFVSHVTRFVFVNQHTLATESFVLGPEAAALARTPRGRRARG